MKKLLFLILPLVTVCWGYAQISYPVPFAGKDFTCTTDETGVLCQLSNKDPLYGEMTLEKPYVAPGSIELNAEKDNLKAFIKKEGYTLFSQQTDSDICGYEKNGAPVAHIVTSTGIDKQNRILQITARVDDDNVILFLHGFPDATYMEKRGLSAESVAAEMCTLKLPTDRLFLFDKWFICYAKELKSKDTLVYACKLEENDPQYKTLFGQNSYATTAPIFPRPQKTLREMLKDKEFGCANYKIFSCPRKDSAVGVCGGQEGETFIQVTPYGVFTLTNTDLKNSIADQKHASELCNITDYDLAFNY